MYNWQGMKKIPYQKVMESLELSDTCPFEYWLYPDGTEVKIGSYPTKEQVAKHYENGGEFGREYCRKEMADIIERRNLLIHNILCEICDKTDIPKEQYEPWLKLEVGMREDEIEELKALELFPEPIAS